MSWPSTDFEVEIQNELDKLRARNLKLESFVSDVSSHLHPEEADCECCREFWWRLATLEEKEVT